MKDLIHEYLNKLARLFLPLEFYYREERIKISEQKEQLRRDYWQHRS